MKSLYEMSQQIDLPKSFHQCNSLITTAVHSADICFFLL